MMEIKWKKLKFDGVDFGSKFEISSKGRIRNIKTKNYAKSTWHHNILYAMIYFDKKTYRIKIGDAQVTSGLTRSIFDKEIQMSGKYSEFTQVQVEQLVELFNEGLIANGLKSRD